MLLLMTLMKNGNQNLLGCAPTAVIVIFVEKKSRDEISKNGTRLGFFGFSKIKIREKTRKKLTEKFSRIFGFPVCRYLDR
jgi:hypothetical protein